MRKPILTARTGHLLVTMLVIAALTGCAQTRDWFSGLRGASSNEQVVLGAPAADEYLSELYALVSGDPATQAEIVAQAKSAVMLTPGQATKLRYAMMLATPGHSGSDPLQAQDLLRELLAQTEPLTPAEKSLATVHLRSAEELVMLGSEMRRLSASTSRASEIGAAAARQHLATIEADNSRLRIELEQAEDKLEAITLIERSIRGQDQANDRP